MYPGWDGGNLIAGEQSSRGKPENFTEKLLCGRLIGWFSDAAKVRHDIADLFRLEGTSPGRHEARFTRGSPAFGYDRHEVVIRKLVHHRAVGMVGRLYGKRCCRRTVPLPLLTVTRRAVVSVELFSLRRVLAPNWRVLSGDKQRRE